MSIHVYARAQVGNGWDVNIPTLAIATGIALSGKVFILRAEALGVTFDFVAALSVPEIATLDAVVVANKAAGPYATEVRATRTEIRVLSPDGSTWGLSISDVGGVSTALDAGPIVP